MNILAVGAELFMRIGGLTDRLDKAVLRTGLKTYKKDDGNFPWILAYIRNNHVRCSLCQFLQPRMTTIDCSTTSKLYSKYVMIPTSDSKCLCHEHKGFSPTLYHPLPTFPPVTVAGSSVIPVSSTRCMMTVRCYI